MSRVAGFENGRVTWKRQAVALGNVLKTCLQGSRRMQPPTMLLPQAAAGWNPPSCSAACSHAVAGRFRWHLQPLALLCAQSGSQRHQAAHPGRGRAALGAAERMPKQAQRCSSQGFYHITALCTLHHPCQQAYRQTVPLRPLLCPA